MSRGSFTSADIYRSHVTMEVIGRIAETVDWSEYTALVEFLALPPLVDPDVFRPLALAIRDVITEWEKVAARLEKEISLERARMPK